MEAEYILTDDVHVAGPVFLEVLALLLIALIGVISERGDIVAKRIEPNIYHMLIVEINGNSPLEGGTGKTEILQTRL